MCVSMHIFFLKKKGIVNKTGINSYEEEKRLKQSTNNILTYQNGKRKSEEMMLSVGKGTEKRRPSGIHQERRAGSALETQTACCNVCDLRS